jgi:hypothetical protein
MKKLYSVLALLTLTSAYSYAQPTCTPNTSMTGYIEPETIGDAVVGYYYEQVIYFRVPSDTTVQNGSQTVPVHVVDTRILSMDGRPGSISYVCNVSNCIFNGGTYGCAVIYGMPVDSENGERAIKIRLKTNTTIFGSPVARIDSGVYDFTIHRWPVGVRNATTNGLYFSVFPNPAANELKLKLGEIRQQASLTVLDITGRAILQREVQAQDSNSELRLELASWPDGVYLVNLSSNGTSSIQKIVVRH